MEINHEIMLEIIKLKKMICPDFKKMNFNAENNMHKFQKRDSSSGIPSPAASGSRSGSSLWTAFIWRGC